MQIYSTSIFEAKNCALFSKGDSASRRLGERKGLAREVEVAEMMRRKEGNLLRVFAQNLFSHFLPPLSLNQDSPPRPAGNFSLPPRRAQTCLGGSLPHSHCHLHMRRRSRWRRRRSSHSTILFEGQTHNLSNCHPSIKLYHLPPFLFPCKNVIAA